MSGWNRQINSDGDTLADAALATAEFIANDQLGAIVAYLDLIAECLCALAQNETPDAGRRYAKLAEIREGPA